MDGGPDRTERPVYRTVPGGARTAVVSLSRELTVERCDAGTPTLLGIDEGDYVGDSVWALFSGAAGTVAETAIESAVRDGVGASFRRDDHGAGTAVVVYVYPDADGPLLFLVDADGGDERRETDRVRPTADTLGVGGWRIDLPSRTLHVSEEVLRTRGLPADYDLTLDEGIRFYHEEDRPVMRAALERLENEGAAYDLELREVTADGDVYWVRSTGVPEYDDDGEMVALRGVYRDITARKEGERELERRTREVERQNERLDGFASTVSHDLRSPLTVAYGRLELAREEGDSEHYDAIENALSRIETLVADVLDVARRGAAVTDPEPVDLAAAAEECWEAVESPDVRLVVRDAPTVLADRSRLQQLLGNLVRNSVEHGSTRSPSNPPHENAVEHARDGVTVTVGGCEGGFYVADDGPGIPPDEREAVFRSGYSTSPTGTGFGLGIVREIAGAHHWAVRVTDAADGGARFEFTDVECIR